MRAVGSLLIAVGAVLGIWAAAYGRSGYYLSETPTLLLLAVLALVCLGVGVALRRYKGAALISKSTARDSVIARAWGASQATASPTAPAQSSIATPAALKPPPSPAPFRTRASSAVDETTRDRPMRGNWQLVLPDSALINVLAGVVIGRRPTSTSGEATLVLASDQVSATHAQFSLQSGHLFVCDLGSTNGTVLVREDGAETVAGAEPIPVDVNDRLELGTFVVRIAQRGWHDESSA